MLVYFFFLLAGEQNQSADVPPTISPPSSTVTLDTISPPSLSSTADVTWPESFQVPRNQMPSELRSAIVNGKRPLPADRCKMIRIIVNEIRKHKKNNNKIQAKHSALLLISKLSNSIQRAFLILMMLKKKMKLVTTPS